MTLTPRGSNDPHPTNVDQKLSFLGITTWTWSSWSGGICWEDESNNEQRVSENKMFVAEEIEQCVKRDGTVLRGATGRDFMPFPGSLSQGMTCKCKRHDSGMMFFDVNMKSLTFPRHVQAPLHLVYCGSWCVTQVYTAYLTSSYLREREREGAKETERT